MCWLKSGLQVASRRYSNVAAPRQSDQLCQGKNGSSPMCSAATVTTPDTWCYSSSWESTGTVFPGARCDMLSCRKSTQERRKVVTTELDDEGSIHGQYSYAIQSLGPSVAAPVRGFAGRAAPPDADRVKWVKVERHGGYCRWQDPADRREQESAGEHVYHTGVDRFLRAFDGGPG